MASAKLSTTVRSRFGKLLRSTSGNATMIVTIAAIPMIGCIGLAVDYMRGVRASEELQHLADAAALAAGSATSVTGTQTQQLAQRAAIATNYITDSVANVSDIELVGEPEVTAGPNTIDVEVNAKVKGSFINVLNAIEDDSAELGGGGGVDEAGDSSSKDISLRVKSKVGFSEDAYLCLLSMHASQTEAIYFQGNSEFMATCSVHANSNATTAIRTWGSAEAYAASFCARGGWAGSGFEPDPEGGCAWVEDPYASMVLPTVGTCITAAEAGLPTSGQTSLTSDGAVVKNASYTLPPGTYCGGIEGKTGAVITLEKGIYVFKDGDLKLAAQAELYAEDGTVIYLSGPTSNLDVTSGAILKIVAPNRSNSADGDDTYPYRGWAFLQKRVAGTANTLYSKGGVNIIGGFYSPKRNLTIWANDVMNNDSTYFPMIVDTLNMNGTSTLYVNLDWDSADLDEPTQLKQAGKVFVSQ